MAGPSSLLLLLSSYLSIGLAHDACSSFAWDSSALRGHCSPPAAGAALRSPACTVFRLCNGGPPSSLVPLGKDLCNTSRIYVSLCADQPSLPECMQFKDQFHQADDYQACLSSQVFPIFSTTAATSFMASSCIAGHAMAGCDRCNATACDTPDPLLAYADGCMDMLMGGCQPWQKFCQGVGATGAEVLCVPPAQRAQQQQLQDEVDDACIQDPTQASCKAYVYPDELALADIERLCGSMPDMPGCAVQAACAEPGQVAARYCKPMVLLATVCSDMPGMKGCANYKALCRTNGSVVEQCKKEQAIPGMPTWSVARKDIFGMCDDHAMEACDRCTRTDCPDPLGTLASLCQEMPGMSACKDFWGFCKAATATDVPKWCIADTARYLPSMLMYFHQRTEELLLWKEWRPMTQGAYAASVIAIVAMGVVSSGLKTLKGALVLFWTHQRSSQHATFVQSVWMPSSMQAKETLIKTCLIGISLTLDYFNMLIAMTFNIGFFCAVLSGYVLGTLLFSHILENYGAILHQRRLAERGRGFGHRLVPDVEAGGVANRLPGSEGKLTDSDVHANAVDARSSSPSSFEDSEVLRNVAGAEAECNCVHST